MRKRGSVFGAVAVAAALALSACGSSGSGGSKDQSGAGEAGVEAAGGTITAAAAYETTN